MEVNTFLMMGRPGSGKGTQGKLLAQKLGAEIYATGTRCRDFAAQPSYFGKKTKEVIESGDLMPEWFSIYLFEDKMIRLEPKDKIVFDGSGRKVLEAHTFDEVARWLGRPYKVIHIDVPEDVLRARLKLRQGSEHRADDGEDSLNLRFERYREHTEPAIEFFRTAGVLTEINGDRPIEEVHDDILKLLELA